jgi:signal transduction histidine kinase
MEGYNATANSIAPLIGLDRVDPITVLMTFGPDIYLISFSAIRDSAGNDPNGLLLMGRKLGLDDLNQIKALTAYDVAFYKGEQQIASVQAQALTPSPADLQSAAQDKMVFNQIDPNIALAYKPLQDEDGNALATMVVWRSRQAVTAAQASISSTFVIWFAVTAVLATVVAFFLGRSIARPLLGMADRATKMAAGDLSQRMMAPYRARDAVVQLVDAFNEMAAKVGTRITDSTRENERLIAVDEYRLNLLTAISQALRTPLSNIRSHSDSLDMALYGSLNDAQRRSVGVIRRAVGIAEALLTDLVDFARAQQKQLQIVRSRLLLVDIVLNVSDAVKQRYADRHCKQISNAAILREWNTKQQKNKLQVYGRNMKR